MATKLKEKPKNIDIVNIAYNAVEKVLVGLGKNGLLYFHNREKNVWYAY